MWKKTKGGKTKKLALTLSGVLPFSAIFLFSMFSTNALLYSTPTPRPAKFIQVDIECVPPWTDACVSIFGIRIFKGKLNKFGFSVGLGLETTRDCPSGEFFQNVNVWIPQQSWGVTNADVCYDESTGIGTIWENEDSQEFQDYEQWEQAAGQ